MITHYCATYEEALRRAKAAGKQPGCHYGGITLPSGKKAFAIYREGKVIERYSALSRGVSAASRSRRAVAGGES